MNLGPTIKRLRQMRQMTQQEVADKAGIGRAYMSRIEHGSRPNCGIEVMERIANAIGVPLPLVVFMAASRRELSGVDAVTCGNVIDAVNALANSRG